MLEDPSPSDESHESEAGLFWRDTSCLAPKSAWKITFLQRVASLALIAEYHDRCLPRTFDRSADYTRETQKRWLIWRKSGDGGLIKLFVLNYGDELRGEIRKVMHL